MIRSYPKRLRYARRTRGKDRRKNPDRRKSPERRKTAPVIVKTPEFGPNSILTSREACQYLRISRPTYQKYIAQGRIRAEKIGRGWKVIRAELDRLLQAGGSEK